MYLGGTSGRCVRNLMHMIAPTRKCHVRAYAPFLADTSAQMLVRIGCSMSRAVTAPSAAQALLYHLSVLDQGGAAVDRARWKAQQLRDGCARSLPPCGAGA